MWDKTGLKGNIPSRVSILGNSFECKLVPKESGKYLIPVPKEIRLLLEAKEEYEISMEPIEMLSRINHDSPYSREHPIGKSTQSKKSTKAIAAVDIAVLLCLREFRWRK
jgi:ribosome biogenesis protein Nip4